VSKEIAAKMLEVVKRNLTEAQRDNLRPLGVLKEDGLFNVAPQVRRDGTVNIQKAADVVLAPKAQGANVGQVVATITAGGVTQNVDISLVKTASGRVFADSNVTIKYGAGKKYTHYIPSFAEDEMRKAWVAFKDILPTYLSAQGII
jgi:hypothetical protein